MAKNPEEETLAQQTQPQEPVQTGDNVAPAPQQNTGEAREEITPLPPVTNPIPQAKAEVQNPVGLAKPQQSVQSGGGTGGDGNPYGWVDQYLPYKHLSPEEIEKEKKRERQEKIFSAIGDGLSAMANLYFASQGAPNMYNPNESMSEKTKARWDKLNKERREDADKYFNARLKTAQLEADWKKGQRDFDFRKQEADRAAAQWQTAFDYKKDQDNRAFQEGQRQFDARLQLQKDEAAREQQNKDRAFDESVRQFNVSSGQQQQRIKNEAKRLAEQEKKGKYTFALGGNLGTVEVPADALNAENVAYLYSLIPEENRSAQGKEISRTWNPAKKQYDVVYDKPSLEAMRIEIGTNIANVPALQDAMCEIAGVEKPKRKKGNPMGGSSSGKKPNPMG